MGITIPEFPIFFVLSRPNTGLGHRGSVIALIESQTRYIVSILEKALDRFGASFEIEVRPEVCHAYNTRVQDAHSKLI